MNSGQGSAYVSTLNTVFGLIDKGDWDSAEKAWMAAPAWMRRRYYANNPSSTLFRGGKGGSGGSGGGIPDAKYKLYIKEMGKWVDLMKNGEDAAADKFFRNMPKWMQDFYLARHPDQALLKENMKMQSLLEEYFLANKASQRAMLKNNPALAKWLMQNDAKAARTNALMFLYDRLPDDPWIKRVFREKYPEVFSKEAEGEAKKQAVWKTLEENPELVAPWQRWYADIIKTLTEAEKYIKARPKQLEVDREDEKRRRHEGGKSAEETSEQIRSYVRQMQNLNKRQPNLEQGIQ